tara:strand:+ start:23 stop:469 length:447 start_codon:yes stop_codon:yes gene_type:complete
MQKNKFFEDFKVGEKYILPSRTQTSGVFSMFQATSGDNDPIHYDREFCKQKGHKDMLAHGMQVLNQTAAGAGTFPSEVRESLIGMIEISGKFLKGVYLNDTLYPYLEIIDLITQKTTGIICMKAIIKNQKQEVVFEGEHKYLVKKLNK